LPQALRFYRRQGRGQQAPCGLPIIFVVGLQQAHQGIVPTLEESRGLERNQVERHSVRHVCQSLRVRHVQLATPRQPIDSPQLSDAGFDAEVLVEHPEGKGLALPINIMIVDSGGEAARVLIEQGGIEYLH